jgi:hypothetical protein
MHDEFLVFGPQEALGSFEREALAAGFQVSRSQRHDFSVGPQNLSECLHLVFSKEGAAIIIALASAIKAFLAAKSSRRVTITKLERDKIGSIDARGFSKEELIEMLPKCRELIVYEPKSKKPKI